MLIGLRREPGDVCGVVVEEIGHDDEVVFVGGRGEDVGALEGLGVETEDVEDIENCLCGGWGTGHILHHELVDTLGRGEGSGSGSVYKS